MYLLRPSSASVNICFCVGPGEKSLPFLPLLFEALRADGPLQFITNYIVQLIATGNMYST